MPETTSDTRVSRLQAIVEHDPTTALYLPLAECLREEGRVDEAIRLCEARKNRPGHGVGDAIVLGRCYLADGRLADARAEFEVALGLDRENVSALKALAGISAHEGRQAHAADLYRAVCRVDPGDLESQTALHQISSGEYAEVSPADVVVGQGDLGWQPVKLPREEDHLSDLGLGLRTIESFDPAPADVEQARAKSFQELTLEELERATAAAATATRTREAADPPQAPGAAPFGAGALDWSDEKPAAREGAVAREAPTMPREAPPRPGPAPDRTSERAPEIPPEAAAPIEAVIPEPMVEPMEPIEPIVPEAGSAPGAKGVPGNRSAFEDWLRRLGGKS